LSKWAKLHPFQMSAFGYGGPQQPAGAADVLQPLVAPLLDPIGNDSRMALVR
jgi:hypothetical protein